MQPLRRCCPRPHCTSLDPRALGEGAARVLSPTAVLLAALCAVRSYLVLLRAKHFSVEGWNGHPHLPHPTPVPAVALTQSARLCLGFSSLPPRVRLRRRLCFALRIPLSASHARVAVLARPGGSGSGQGGGVGRGPGGGGGGLGGGGCLEGLLDVGGVMKDTAKEGSAPQCSRGGVPGGAPGRRGRRPVGASPA